MGTLEQKIDDYMLNKISFEEIEGVTDIHYRHFGNIDATDDFEDVDIE